MCAACDRVAVWPCSQPARSICVRRGRGSRVFGQGSVSERPKVQHSKCCVVSQPPWVQIPALPPLPPGPIGAGRFCYAYVACVGLVAPTDLRPSRGLPARSPSAPRASLGASARSPARPRRPRGGLQSVGVSVCCLAWPRRPRASQPGPPVTAGALHASGAFVADVAGASACCSARTRRPRAPRPGPPAPPTPSMLAAVGVCSIRGWLSACRRRVMVLMTPFPPFGDGEITG